MQRPLKIGLDVAPLGYPYSGVRAYVEALIEEFRNRDFGIELTPIGPAQGKAGSTNRLARLRWDLQGASGAAADAEVDALHMTRFAAPNRVRMPLLVTVHDLIPLQLPAYRASMAAKIQIALACRTVSRASRLIVPSQYVAGEVQALFAIEPSRIDVIPMGVAPPADRLLPPVIEGPYIVHTGGFDVRKNLPSLIEAFGLARQGMGDAWRLVLVGAPHSENSTVYPPIQPVIESLGLTDCVVLTGRVSEDERNALYQHATIAVNPSLSEGFGLPILEAMSYGIPVIASNGTAHPEVAGDAALLVEPEIDTLAGAISLLAADSAKRAELAVRGRLRAAEFPWSRTAKETAIAYRRAFEMG